MSDACPRAGKWIGGCQYEPRYDIGKTTLTEANGMYPDAWIGIIEAAKPKTYVRDVCVRCGRTIERVPALPQPNQP